MQCLIELKKIHCFFKIYEYLCNNLHVAKIAYFSCAPGQGKITNSIQTSYMVSIF